MNRLVKAALALGLVAGLGGCLEGETQTGTLPLIVDEVKREATRIALNDRCSNFYVERALLRNSTATFTDAEAIELETLDQGLISLCERGWNPELYHLIQLTDPLTVVAQKQRMESIRKLAEARGAIE